MRKLFLHCLAALLALLALPALASHIAGGDISYSPLPATVLSMSRYRVTLHLSCAASMPTSTQINVVSTNCLANSALSVTLPLKQTTNSLPLACPSSTLPYYTTVYEGELSLPVGQGQWLLTYVLNSRNYDIQNISTVTTGVNFFLSAYLDNTLPSLNNAPHFESVLQPYLSATHISPHSFSAFDTDGDSLRYEFMFPLGNCNQALPGTLSPHFQINTATGAVTSASNASTQSGLYDMAVKVSEFRKLNGQWQLIGYVMRDITYVTYVTANQPPAFTSLQVNTGPAQPLDQLIQVQPGQTIRLTLSASDPDPGQQVRFASEVGTVVPGMSVATVNGQLLLTWDVPTTLPPGTYPLVAGVLDNGCTYSASEERTLLVRVSNQPLATRASAALLAPAYPTPFSEHVQFTTAPNQAVCIVDALGREVARLRAGADGRVQWQPTAGLPNGLYLARTADGTPLARLLRAQ